MKELTIEEKQLLLKDLCARLPYKPICFKKITNCIPSDSVLLEEDIYSFRTRKPTIDDYGQHDYYKTVVLELKPYLRSISSMTEGEKHELYQVFQECPTIIKTFPSYAEFFIYADIINSIDMANVIDWLNAHHFDYRGLIGKGLAIEAPKGMYN